MEVIELSSYVVVISLLDGNWEDKLKIIFLGDDTDDDMRSLSGLSVHMVSVYFPIYLVTCVDLTCVFKFSNTGKGYLRYLNYAFHCSACKAKF